MQTLQLLSEVIAAYEASLQNSSAGSTAAQQPEASAEDAAGLGPVLAAVLEPLLEMVMRSAEALSPDSPARLDDGGKLDPTAYKVLGPGNCLDKA